MDIEAIKEKYPLAVDTLRYFGKGFKYDRNSGFIVAPNGTPLDIVEVRGWGIIQYKDNAEARQDQIGEMLSELLNQLTKP
jgi:hypothetical protein